MCIDTIQFLGIKSDPYNYHGIYPLVYIKLLYAGLPLIREMRSGEIKLGVI
jgi:hypothetical protein